VPAVRMLRAARRTRSRSCTAKSSALMLARFSSSSAARICPRAARFSTGSSKVSPADQAKAPKPAACLTESPSPVSTQPDPRCRRSRAGAQGVACGGQVGLGKPEPKLECAQLGIGFERAADVGGFIHVWRTRGRRVGRGEKRGVHLGGHAKQALQVQAAKEEHLLTRGHVFQALGDGPLDRCGVRVGQTSHANQRLGDAQLFLRQIEGRSLMARSCVA
jgi:hypothetical protein